MSATPSGDLYPLAIRFMSWMLNFLAIRGEIFFMELCEFLIR
jgi:hypothetical protein